MNETLGKIHFVLTFIFFNCTFFPMHILGITGMPRRIAGYLSYDTYGHLQPMNLFISISAFALGLSQIPSSSTSSVAGSGAKRLPTIPGRPTRSSGPRPPAPAARKFRQTPDRPPRPLRIQFPLVDEDWLPQTRYVEGAEELAKKHH